MLFIKEPRSSSTNGSSSRREACSSGREGQAGEGAGWVEEPSQTVRIPPAALAKVKCLCSQLRSVRHLSHCHCDTHHHHACHPRSDGRIYSKVLEKWKRRGSGGGQQCSRTSCKMINQGLGLFWHLLLLDSLQKRF